jgi:hypothetical protein
MPKRKQTELAPAPVEMASLTRCIKELERAVTWGYALTGDRSQEAPRVTVVIQTKGQRRMCAWFSPKRWETREGQPVHEITMCAEELHKDPVETIGTMLHETNHLWNNDMGIVDCSLAGRHNKKFKESGEGMFGLVVEMQGSRGWAQTSLTPEMRERIEKEFQPDFLAFDLARKTVQRIKKPSTTVKWSCGCQIVWRARKLDLKSSCDICGAHFERGN